MRNLQKYTGAVTGIGIGTLTTAVIHIVQDNKCLLQDFIRLLAIDISNNANTTGIMLKPRVIKALLGR